MPTFKDSTLSTTQAVVLASSGAGWHEFRQDRQEIQQKQIFEYLYTGLEPRQSIYTSKHDDDFVLKRASMKSKLPEYDFAKPDAIAKVFEAIDKNLKSDEKIEILQEYLQSKQADYQLNESDKLACQGSNQQFTKHIIHVFFQDDEIKAARDISDFIAKAIKSPTDSKTKAILTNETVEMIVLRARVEGFANPASGDSSYYTHVLTHN